MFYLVVEIAGDSEESTMKKLFKNMTKDEQTAFANELHRIYMNGTACLQAAAKNANEKFQGWPLITTYDSGNVVETPICDALDVLLEVNKQEVMQGMNLLSLMSSGEATLHMILHQTLHDAFCLGIAAVTEMEMDFNGYLDFLQQKDDDIHSQ